MERDSRLGSSQTVALVAVRQSSEGASDSRARVCQTVGRGCARQSSDCLPTPQTSLFYQTILRKIYACFWCMGWSRAMLSSALPRCSLLHQGDAPSCTQAMLSRAPKATGHIGSFWRKSSRASKGSSPVPRRETFPCLDGRPSRASTGDLPAPRRETFPRLGGRPSRKAKGRLPARRRETFTQQQPDYYINTKLL